MRLLDLFCGAGGAAMGYYRAGFDEIVGIDYRSQPRFPFDFVLANALNPPVDLNDFDLIHASPPCQAYSIGTRNMGTAEGCPDLLEDTRKLLQSSDTFWVIENVPGAPMRIDLMLCGSMFGLQVKRHRWFELSDPTLLLLTPTCKHVWKRGRAIGVYGHGTPTSHLKVIGPVYVDDWREAMGIDWMVRKELSEAIPPAYTEWIAHRFISLL